jgi:hypothetical protein
VSNTAHGLRRTGAHVEGITAPPVAPFGDWEFSNAPVTIRGPVMESFIHAQNIAHFRKVLSETTEPTRRRTVLRLLADELAKDQEPSKITPYGYA